MAIQRINQETCIGCGLCVRACPVDVIRMNTEIKKAYVRYPMECMICCNCVAECPTDSIVIDLEKNSPVPTSW